MTDAYRQNPNIENCSITDVLKMFKVHQHIIVDDSAVEDIYVADIVK